MREAREVYVRIKWRGGFRKRKPVSDEEAWEEILGLVSQGWNIVATVPISAEFGGTLGYKMILQQD